MTMLIARAYVRISMVNVMAQEPERAHSKANVHIVVYRKAMIRPLPTFIRPELKCEQAEQ